MAKPTRKGNYKGEVLSGYTWNGTSWILGQVYSPQTSAPKPAAKPAAKPVAKPTVASNYGVGAGKTATGKTTVIGKSTPKPAAKPIIASNYGVGAGTNAAGKINVIGKVDKPPVKKVVPTKTAGSTPIKTPKVFADPVVPPTGETPPEDFQPQTDPVGNEMDLGMDQQATMDAQTAVPWTLESDPVFQAAMASGSSTFNMARNAALAAKQNAETGAAGERRQLDVNAAENRRRLAGNYAARGMAGGTAGALTMAEAQANARQVADRTSIADQISALNQDYLANYGAAGTDWTGTLMGQQYKTQAAQAAIQAQLAKYGVA
jgi:hypothetical protein